MTNNTPDYEDNLYFDTQNTKKDLCITVEKQVWESTLHRSMVLQAENAQLKEYERIVTSYNMKPIDYDIACETVNKLFDDNKRLKHDVGNLGYKIKNQQHEIDNRLKEIEKLKELLKESELWFTGIVGNMNDKNVGEHNKSVPIGNFEHIFKEFSQKINEVLK